MSGWQDGRVAMRSLPAAQLPSRQARRFPTGRFMRWKTQGPRDPEAGASRRGRRELYSEPHPEPGGGSRSRREPRDTTPRRVASPCHVTRRRAMSRKRYVTRRRAVSRRVAP